MRIFLSCRDANSRFFRIHFPSIINAVYFSANIIRVIKPGRMRWAGHVARTGERRGVCRILVGKPERPLGRLRCRREDHIKMELQEVGCGGTD